jgi:hypothetical protein
MKSTLPAFLSNLTRFIGRFQGSLGLPSLNRKVPSIASLDEVTIIRDAAMSDREIIDFHNDRLRNDAKHAVAYKNVAFEVPLGSPQIEYFARCAQWVPRGHVLRCQIQENKRGQLVVKIDEQELQLKQFGKLLSAFVRWGLRIEFVAEEEVHRRPHLEVREPKSAE